LNIVQYNQNNVLVEQLVSLKETYESI